MPFNISELPVSKLRGFREFAFAPALAEPSHQPFFSLETHESWTSKTGYELYDIWLKNSENIALDSCRGQDLVDRATPRDIKKFREIITTPFYAKDEYFSTENVHNWIRPVAFEAWMLWLRQATGTNVSRPSSRMSVDTDSSVSRPPSQMSETVDFSSDEVSPSLGIPPSSRATSDASSVSGNPENPITISDSDSDEDFFRRALVKAQEKKRLTRLVKKELKEEPNIRIKRSRSTSLDIREVKAESAGPAERLRTTSPDIEVISGPSPSAKKSTGKKHTNLKGKGREPDAIRTTNPFKLTSRLAIDQLSTVTSLPSTWTVPRNNSATLVDLSALDSFPRRPNGQEYSIDGYIRAEDQDSWGGSTGHSNGEFNVFGFYEDPDRSVWCRRTQLECNGLNTCEPFNEDLLQNCQRFDPDPEEMRELWNHELDATTYEAGSEKNIITRFYSRIMRLKCKITDCEGRPVMRQRGNGKSKYGKEHFIGCSVWKKSEEYQHRYLAIPSNVDEDLLSKVIDANGVFPSNITNNDRCALTVHPKVGLKMCPYSHVINGKISASNMVKRKCPTRMIIFIPIIPDPKNPSIPLDPLTKKKAIVYVHGAHNHPMHPKSKPSSEDKLQLKKAIAAVGKRGLTVQKLLNAPSTSAIFGGQQLSIASPAYMDRRRLRNEIHDQKTDLYPKGMEWEGLVHLHLKRESKLPITERYIHAVMSTGDTRWVITMHPRLAKYFHDVYYLVIDYTFKRVKGNIDEWEVVGFLEKFKRRVTLARFYCDRNTRNAFSRLFSELFHIGS